MRAFGRHGLLQSPILKRIAGCHPGAANRLNLFTPAASNEQKGTGRLVPGGSGNQTSPPQRGLP
jgi:hypothetical protein